MRRVRKNALNSEMNIVPYVDVMFVLLTIFMVTATTISVGIDVDPPSVENTSSFANSEDSEQLVISVDAENKFYLNIADSPTQAISEEQITELASKAFAKNNKIIAIVKGDKNANYGRIIDAMALLQRITNKTVSLAASPQDKE